MTNNKGMDAGVRWPDMVEQTEIASYFTPKELFGKKVENLEELANTVNVKDNSILILQEKGSEGISLELGTGFERYSAQAKGIIMNIGYKCPSCCQIIIGPPKIRKEYISKGRGVSQDAITYSCGNCDKVLQVNTGMFHAGD